MSDRSRGRRRRPADPAAARPGEPPLAILVDYDGTIAQTDVSDTVMAEHVPGIWEAEAAAYDAGLMGSRRLMTWEMAQVDADPADLLATAAAQPHDPGFVPFVRRAQAAGIPVEVVSDGFGFFIRPALEALGVGELPVVTARTTFADRGAAIAFPNGHPRCHVCGTCKRNRVLEHQAAGSGGRVHRRRGVGSVRRGLRDVVFAKHSLINICLEAGWPFQRWTEFEEIDAWLAGALRAWSTDEGIAAGAGRATGVLRARGLGQGPRRSARGVLAAEALGSVTDPTRVMAGRAPLSVLAGPSSARAPRELP